MSPRVAGSSVAGPRVAIIFVRLRMGAIIAHVNWYRAGHCHMPVTAKPGLALSRTGKTVMLNYP